MEAYKYKAIDQTGRTHSGVLNAKSESEIASILRGRDMTPISITIEGKQSTDISQIKIFKKKIKLIDICNYCRQLATMLRAGMAIDRALSTLMIQTENPTMKEVIGEVASHVKQGNPLAKAMSAHLEAFPLILINMVAAGEQTGGIDNALDRMALHFEKENRINSKIRGAMIYPCILMALTIIVLIVLLVFVIPTFVTLFESAGGGLPALTQFIVNVSNFLVGYWWLLIGIIAVAVFLFRRWLGSKRGRYRFDGWKVSIPMIKGPMKQIVTARFTRTLSTMISSGIAMIPSLEAAGNTVNNVVVKEKVDIAINDIRKGGTMSAQLRQTGVFPEMMVSMIGIGEETGEIDKMLAQTADYYDEEFDNAMTKLMSFIEPLMIVFMAGIIGFVVISMYMPMFEMYGTIS